MDGESKSQCDSANSASEELPLFTLKRQRGHYWNFIKLVAPRHEKRTWESKDAIAAWCERCRVKIAYSLGNINSVKSHLRTKHPDHYTKESKRPSKRVKVDTKITDVFSSMQNIEMKPATKGDIKKAEALLVHWSATSLRPFTQVEDPGFVALWTFLNSLRTRVQPPSRNKHKEQLIKISNLVMKKVREKIQRETDYFAMTTDIWSSRTMESYMAITIHYLTTEFVMKDFTLEVTPLQGSHTGDYIREFWSESISRFGLNKDKLSMMMRDNASNGIKACNDWGVQHFGCIAHSIHLVIGTFLLEKGSNEAEKGSDDEEDDDIIDFEDPKSIDDEEQIIAVRKLVTKVRTILKYIKYSGKAKERLGTYCSNGETTAVVLDVRTRWNSALDMVQKFLKLKNPIEQFLAFLSTSQGKREFLSKTLPDIMEAEWAVLMGLCELLKPFKDVTATLSGNSYPTFALALPLLRRIKGILSDETLLELTLSSYSTKQFFGAVINQLKACQRILLANFKERFTGLDASILWISCLDPRMRGMKHLTASERTFATEKVVEETLNLSLDQDNVPAAVETESDILSSGDDAQDLGIFDSPQGLRSEIALSPDSADSHIQLRKGHIQLELGNYLSPKTIVSSREDPLEWWKKNHNIFPNLALTARKWLSVCATSTASERVFSSCGVALTAKRSKMSGSTLQAQILLKNNLPCSDLSIDDMANAL